MSRKPCTCFAKPNRNRRNSGLHGASRGCDAPFTFALVLLILWCAAVACAAAEAPNASHWANVAPQQPVLPEVQDRDWPQNELDYFVLQRLEQEGLSPTAPADKITLIRRVTLDLTGLPPTPKEVESFLADPSDDAYEKVVDRLLHSEQYAERMTAWWLDLARYADTHGYEGDGPRNIWLYRDWVIDAFMRGLAFDRFTIEQLAGDLLPDAGDDQRIATGFHRNTPFCYEAGTDLEQFRVESVIDRVNTTMTVWMGTTMACAQCHDHKYDPFSQREYFQLYAFFNNSAESAAGSGTITATSPLSREAVAQHSVRLAELRAAYAADRPERVAEQRHWEDTIATDQPWQIIVPSEVKSLHGADLERLDDHSILAGGKNPDHDVYELTFVSPELSLVAIGMEVLKHDSLPQGGPGRYESNGNFGLSNLQLEYATPDHPDQWQAVRFQKALASYEEGGDEAGGAIDDDAATNWCTNQNAAHATFLADKAYRVPKGSVLRIQMRHDSQWDRHGVGRFRMWAASGDSVDGVGDKELAPLPTFALLEIPRDQRTADEQRQLTEYYRTLSPVLAPIRREIASLERQMTAASTLVMVERDEPRETHVFHRGSFLDPGEAVEPGVPDDWHAWPEGEEFNRLGLARWLMRPENPLLARVTMNRIWALLFGKGIVETSEDFGTQCSTPSHPLLLDHLATEFASNGWNLQAMQKQIVTSATYRQSSVVTPDRLEHDPDNGLFSRGPVFRLDAEMIRDNALAVSGLLTQQLGGPGVYPDQPPGVFEQIHSFTTQWNTSSDGQQHRRALYTWWKRTAPYPSLITFDMPQRNVCVERRPRTNTPLQALVTLNDPVFVECAAALGRRMVTEIEGNERQRATFGFRLCVARPPTAAELEHLIELYRENLAIYQRDTTAATDLVAGERTTDIDPAELAAWSVVGNVLLNLDETLTKY